MKKFPKGDPRGWGERRGRKEPRRMPRVDGWKVKVVGYNHREEN